MRVPTTILAAMTLTACGAAEAKSVKAEAPTSPELTEVTPAEQAEAQASLKERVKQVLIRESGAPEYVDPCPPCGMG